MALLHSNVYPFQGASQPDLIRSHHFFLELIVLHLHDQRLDVVASGDEGHVVATLVLCKMPIYLLSGFGLASHTNFC